MSRLFESFGDDADEAKISVGSRLGDDAEVDGEADAFAGLGEGDEETTSLLAELAEEAPALEPAPRALSLSTDEETNLPPGGRFVSSSSCRLSARGRSTGVTAASSADSSSASAP